LSRYPWLRIGFNAPTAWAGHDLSLNLGSFSDLDTVYVNGVEVGRWVVGVQKRTDAVPGNIVVGGRNLLAIRVLTGNLGPGVYGGVNDLSVSPENDSATKLTLGNLTWKYKVGQDLKDTSVQPPAIVDTSVPSGPTLIYNGIVAPLVPMAIKGIIWYQGESSTNNALLYRTLLPLLISDWRAKFESGSVPFLVVQLSSVGKGDTSVWSPYWAQLREAQLLTTENVSNTGLVVTSDIGDPTNVHYPDKQDLGSRLATSALAMAYGKKIEYEGPIYKSMKIESGSIRIFSTHTAGLKVKGDKQLDFTIAGGDNKLVPADAVIDGGSVVVSSPSVPNPVSVRYGWASYSIGNLYNGANLPASSFRTDSLPYVPQQTY